MNRNELNRLIERREEGRAKQDQAMLAEVREQLLTLLAHYPDDAQINYQTGIAHDNSGLGREAIPYYERALALGLAGPDLERCLMGLGSTYRYWGHYEQAVSTLRRGAEEFPDNRAIQVFLAMALYNRQSYKESVEQLIATLMETTADEKLLYFKRSILGYAEDLDETAE
ncbi:tetratricopeptide repeat protein [Paenibacillus sacheonensis]|uniref:Tetratricopeptide repeat protein n=1 Tax=Paenibacillus sacheonensis TaxID=742054 RepID=A0A7X4YPK8_9BACL|nr:tetratricopeptide repeat protein [Paenibacillus sacheonensis]MBM7565047.1 tetratricopeptide (TPR) repeat protein [Paenibacillus sacheonensis]NBC70168.1 tetratricopeptide repeat protein [Paenibacillus sacheonensis]